MAHQSCEKTDRGEAGRICGGSTRSPSASRVSRIISASFTTALTIIRPPQRPHRNISIENVLARRSAQSKYFFFLQPSFVRRGGFCSPSSVSLSGGMIFDRLNVYTNYISTNPCISKYIIAQNPHVRRYDRPLANHV